MWQILFIITSSDVGGTESILRELVLRLDSREFRPLVLSLRHAGHVGKEIAAAGIEVHSLQMREKPRVWDLTAGAVKVAGMIDDERIDLVQSFLYRANVVARLAARLSRRRPFVVTGHRSLTPHQGRGAALAARLTRNLSDRNVVVSQAVLDRLRVTEKLPVDRTVLIENGVDTRRFSPDGIHADTNRFGLSADGVVVGTVGRLSPEKGVHLLIRSVALAREQGAELKLVVVGDGLQRTQLEREVRSLGIENVVKFLGVRRELRPVYATLDIFALPSLKEGSPNSLLEAMAMSRAVVATRVGGVPEIVEHDRSGVLVRPGSVEELARALTRLAGDALLRQRLAGTARQRVMARFEISQVVDKHTQLYRELLTQQSRDAARKPSVKSR